MAAAGLKLDARRAKILEILEQEGRVSVTRLSQMLGATPVTIRSDLDALESSGSLERIPGGAMPKARTQAQLSYVRNLPQKQAIAAAAAAVIHDGDTLFINSGTTTLEVALALKQRRNLNIVTNSIAIASELSGTPTFRVILLGGEVNEQYGFTCGGDAQEQLRKYKADYAILSPDGVSPEDGVTTYHADEAIIDQIMAARSKQTMIVADHSKVGYGGFSMVVPLVETQILITDSGADVQILDALRAAHMQVICAKPSI